MPADMKFAIFGDIHANLEAFEAVLKHAAEQAVTHYVCVGDIVGYNANPIECMEKVRELKCTSVRGNHDHYCSHDEDLESFHPMAAAVIDWTRKQLSEEQKSWLKHLHYKRAVENFTVVHSTLDMPDKWGYVFDNLDAMTNFNYQLTSVCFHGHTHVPVAFERGSSRSIKTIMFEKLSIEQGNKYFINVGSVGQPRDGDPRAAYVTYDFNNKKVELHRVEYDIAAAQAKIIEAGLPEWLAERIGIGK